MVAEIVEGRNKTKFQKKRKNPTRRERNQTKRNSKSNVDGIKIHFSHLIMFVHARAKVLRIISLQ